MRFDPVHRIFFGWSPLGLRLIRLRHPHMGHDVWNFHSGVERPCWRGHVLAFSPDGFCLALLRVIPRCASGIWRQEFLFWRTCQLGQIRKVFSRRSRLASALDDHTVLVLDVTTWEVLQEVCSPVFSPDGRYLVSASDGNGRAHLGHC